MASIFELGFQSKNSSIRFSDIQPSAIQAEDGSFYHIGILAEPVEIRCSTDPKWGPELVDQCLVEAKLMTKECKLWDKDDQGWFIPSYILDWSKTHTMARFGAETIKSYLKGKDKIAKDEKDLKSAETLATMRERIKAKMAGN